MRGPEERRFFTTGELARYCAVSTDTVVKWIRRGELRSFATPGGHHRVDGEAFRRFARRRGMPLDESFFDRSPVTLLVDGDRATLARLRRILRSIDPPPRIAGARNGYDAGIKAGALRPELVVLGPRALGGGGGLALCRSIRRDPATRRARILAVAPPPLHGEVRAAGADVVLEVCSPAAAIARAARELLREKARRRRARRQGGTRRDGARAG